ncbi:MAG: GNAT family N-acetyltransferase [Actinomycetota bacterium]|nr:GNAT family N-acetyltransferase [Actinomycetota bacterium]
MAWTLTNAVGEHEAAAGSLLRRDPVAHTIALTVLDGAKRVDDAVVFGYWTDDDGQVTGAVSRTPGFPWLIAELPDRSVRQLAERVAHDAPAALVAGRADVAAHLAIQVAACSGAVVRLRSVERLYRLSTLVPPFHPGGAPRVAETGDVPLLVPWFAAFQDEAGVVARDPEPLVRERVRDGLITLWEHTSGPVSLAGQVAPACGVARIGPVYTPPEHRGRGYGAAVTAAAVQRALGDAADVVLFTDLTNATSNALYARLGFVPVHDRAIFAFDTAATSP